MLGEAYGAQQLSSKQDQLAVLGDTGEDFLSKSRPNVSSELTSSPTESSTSGTPCPPVSLNQPRSTSSRTATMSTSRPLLHNWSTPQSSLYNNF